MEACGPHVPMGAGPTTGLAGRRAGRTGRGGRGTLDSMRVGIAVNFKPPSTQQRRSETWAASVQPVYTSPLTCNAAGSPHPLSCREGEEGVVDIGPYLYIYINI
jgi:hypothetical protein